MWDYTLTPAKDLVANGMIYGAYGSWKLHGTGICTSFEGQIDESTGRPPIDERTGLPFRRSSPCSWSVGYDGDGKEQYYFSAGQFTGFRPM